MLDKYGVGQDPYCYPGTAVLRNHLGIAEYGLLAEAERALSEVAAESIEFTPPPYDLSYLKSIHQRLFSDLYDWAGELRTVDISKDETHFCMTSRIEPEANKLFDSLAKADWFQNLDRTSLISASAELFGDINVVHPFREGNGRVTREYFGQLAKDAEYKLDFSGVSRQEWNNAAKKSDRGDLEPIKAIFREISTPQRAITFDIKNNHIALAQHPELDGAYKKLYEAKISGKDIADEKKLISKELHAGKIIDAGITPGESLKVIEHAAKVRGLTTHPPGELGTKHAGTIIAKSSHHVLLQVNENTAIRYDRKMLGENLQVGEKLTLQHQENKQVNNREISDSRGLERSSSLQQKG